MEPRRVQGIHPLRGLRVGCEVDQIGFEVRGAPKTQSRCSEVARPQHEADPIVVFQPQRLGVQRSKRQAFLSRKVVLLHPRKACRHIVPARGRTSQGLRRVHQQAIGLGGFLGGHVVGDRRLALAPQQLPERFGWPIARGGRIEKRAHHIGRARRASARPHLLQLLHRGRPARPHEHRGHPFRFGRAPLAPIVCTPLRPI